jgi:hypothetical protein|tara:strand:+ start:200 stop:466 length:267 start_codon:yes stop_codon:yes gene_type:complete
MMKKHLWLGCAILFPLLSWGESFEQGGQPDEPCGKKTETTESPNRCSQGPPKDAVVVGGRAVGEKEYRELELRRQLNTTADVDMPDDI